MNNKIKEGPLIQDLTPTPVVDEKDKQVGKVGYEINFNRYFYKYTPARPLEEIEADIRTVEQEIMAMLREITE